MPVYFTLQPGGAYIHTPPGKKAQLVYPNSGRYRNGTPFDFWQYDAEGKGWYVYGMGEVVGSERQVVPDPDVGLYELTSAMANSGRTPPIDVPSGVTDGEPVDLASGLFILRQTDLALPDVIPITLTRTYHSTDSYVRPFGIGMTHPYELYLFSVDNTDPYGRIDLVLPDGSLVHYVRPEGANTNDPLNYVGPPSVFGGSTLQRFSPGWNLTLKNGTIYHFPLDSPLAYIRDRFGNQLLLTRSPDARGDIVRITSPNGRWMAFSYDAPNCSRCIRQAQDNSGRVIDYVYDQTMRLSTVKDGQGNVLARYTYYPDGCQGMYQITDARGITYLTNEYTPNPDRATDCLVRKQTLVVGSVYEFSYPFRPLLMRTGGGGRGCVGGVCPAVQPPPPPSPPETNVWVTDTVHPDPIRRRVTFDFHSSYPLTDTRAVGLTEEQTVVYNDGVENINGVITSIQDAMTPPRRTEFSYDARLNVTSVTRLAGTSSAATMALTYEPTFSRVTSIAEPGLPPTTFQYDAKGDLTVVDPTGIAVNVAFNPEGRVLGITDALLQSIAFAYDGGDLIAITDAKGATRRFVDAAGRVTSVIDPLGRVTSYEYYPSNALKKITDPRGGAIALTYDANGNGYGNLRTVTDSRRGMASTTTYEYDSMDRLFKRTDPLGRVEKFERYDFGGRVGAYTDRRNKLTIVRYDALGRPTFTGFGRTGPDWAASYESTILYPEYDGGDRLLRLIDSVGGTMVRGFDGLDNLTCESRGTSLPCGASQANAVTSTYDAAGRRQTLQVSGSDLVCYHYDPADRLTFITLGTCAAFPALSIDYDEVGRRSSVVANNISETYGYDATSRITSIQARNEGTGNVLGGLTYKYDAAGNVTEVGGSAARMGLPAETAVVAGYDNANRLTSWNGAALVPGSNENGDMRHDGTGRIFTWDERGQLSAVAGPGWTATFTYDGFGRRQRRVLGSNVTDYVYDGLNPVQERAGTAPPVNLLTGFGIDEFFTRTEGTDVRRVLTDPLGSTVAIANDAGAAPYTYEPFGKATAVAGNGNAHQFTGRDNDSICQAGTNMGKSCLNDASCGTGGSCVSTGLYYYRARYYQATFGRFVSEDPIEFSGGDTNLYVYVGNSPTNFSDETGLCVIDTALDVGFIGNDLYALWTGGRKDLLSDSIALAADLIGLALPGITGLGVFSRAFTADQAALIALAREARRGGVTASEAKILRGWAREYRLPFRGPELHPRRPYGRQLHIHVGPVDHIPVMSCE